MKDIPDSNELDRYRTSEWDSICTSLFDHASQTGDESLAWMLVKMVADRFHGQWRVEGNGGRVSALSDVQSREKWLFAVKARLGVVDGWLRQNGGRPYSRHLFEGNVKPNPVNGLSQTQFVECRPDEDVLQLLQSFG